jgi:hypothetical protein
MKKSDGTGYTDANAPASAWIEEDKKHEGDESYIANSEQIKHEGDLYYNKESGQCYRWVCDRESSGAHGEVHYWMLIQDNDIALALQNAAAAQETANGKMTVYGGSSLPTDANEGDLLIPTTTFTSSNITYKASRVYKYSNSNWTEINYTDSSVNTDKFSWEFSPTDGMFMWEGN